jgi:hypothetical protein
MYSKHCGILIIILNHELSLIDSFFNSYLQNVCNHPKLVLKPTHPEFQNIVSDLRRTNTSMDDIQHSAKLPALK